MVETSSKGGGAAGGSEPRIDRARWEELVASSKPDAMLVVIASSMSKQLREHSSPEDIWQETLALAWRDRAQHSFETTAAFRAWLFEIAKNRIRETARRLASRKRGSGNAAKRMSDLGASSRAELHPADSITPSRIVSRSERKEAVERALAELPPKLGLILRLHLIDELTMETIAERLGIGVSAAWHRYRKGSELIARSLPGWANDSSSHTG